MKYYDLTIKLMKDDEVLSSHTVLDLARSRLMNIFYENFRKNNVDKVSKDSLKLKTGEFYYISA